jgi:histidinol-phosphatase
MENNEPIIGVVHFPVLGETMYAARGDGCWYQQGSADPIQIHVNGETTQLQNAMVSASGVQKSDIRLGMGNKSSKLSVVIQGARKVRFFGDCLQHALVCRGKLDAAIDTVMQPWDVAALIPCIEEAGGIATTLDGKREGVVFGGNLLTSCNQALHDEMVDMLRS